MKLSVVIPAYNESASVRTLHEKLLVPELKKLKVEPEIIYVDDGSTDTTLSILTDIAEHDDTIRVVALSRNFGKEIATTAGIAASTGDATIMLDADGQHPPALIGQFVEEWQKGAQVVIGVRGDAPDYSLPKRLGSGLYNRVFNSVLDTKAAPNATDFRLIDREVREAFLRLPERNRLTRGLIDWLGFKRTYIPFDAAIRIAGPPTYSFRKLVKLASYSIISLSLKPLFWLIWTGFGVTIISFLLGLFIIIEQLILGDPWSLDFTGSAMLGVFISFLVGIVLMSEGVIALYIANIHEQTRARPLYIVDKKHSVNLRETHA
jgi:dolichol-phosphate mannosyltransferase